MARASDRDVLVHVPSTNHIRVVGTERVLDVARRRRPPFPIQQLLHVEACFTEPASPCFSAFIAQVRSRYVSL